MNSKSIVVVGSVNMDLVGRTPSLPKPGETILGTTFAMVPGGKGANQAYAAARLGAKTYLVAKLGKDSNGDVLRQSLEQVGIQQEYITLSGTAASGVALILVEDQGENQIVVIPGSNGELSPVDVQAAEEEIARAGAVVAQLEVPMETVYAAAELAEKHQVPFILNPAPAQDLPKELIRRVSILTPNEHEAGLLTGVSVIDINSAKQAAGELLKKGATSVVITMGSKGCLVADTSGMEFVEPVKVKAVDTTAAGDAFTGALAFGIAQGQSLSKAVDFAKTVAALAVTRKGAQPSMPTREEVEAFFLRRGFKEAWDKSWVLKN